MNHKHLSTNSPKIDDQPSQEDLKTYQNENVVFKIHSPKGNDNYLARTFPAKFSINITNQTNELNSGKYDFDLSQPNIYSKMN